MTHINKIIISQNTTYCEQLFNVNLQKGFEEGMAQAVGKFNYVITMLFFGSLFYLGATIIINRYLKDGLDFQNTHYSQTELRLKMEKVYFPFVLVITTFLYALSILPSVM